MSRLDINARVFAENVPELADQEAPCMWFARCTNPANGLRDHPVLDQVPICQRCDDRVEALS
ncbi:hypothetical protein SEA_RACHALY_84 [Mycobacterium Phage Rachaly]|nr:hypothetical protein SEA_RACHALY_84 [Mycobacterium Phage Rachaly]QGH78777.1 hypothetical protein SEA_MIKO_83 [Mycobacterium phage Miko]